MADNYVSFKIKADDTAKPDLTELKASLDELGHKIATAKVDVDDADGEVKLLRMNAKLADLNRKVANPNIRVTGAARAEADIAALDLELDKLNAKTDELKAKADASGKGGLLGRLLFGSGGSGGSGGFGRRNAQSSRNRSLMAAGPGPREFQGCARRRSGSVSRGRPPRPSSGPTSPISGKRSFAWRSRASRKPSAG